MERIKLSKVEKRVILLLWQYDASSLDTLSRSQVRRALRNLEEMSLVKVAWIEGDDYKDACLTRNGKDYLIENPKLNNPTDWHKISAIAAIISAVGVTIGLFIACQVVINF